MKQALVGMLSGVVIAMAVTVPATMASAAAPAAAKSVGTPKALASCAGCHDLTAAKKKKMGPPLFGLYGSKPTKASIAAAKWDDASLDKYLANPSAMDPKTTMFFKIKDAGKRADVVKALKTLK